MSEIQELQNKIVQSQSKSFEMIAQLTEERDGARKTVQVLESIVNQVVSILEIENPKIEDIYEKLNKLMSYSKDKATPPKTPKVKKIS